MKGKATLILTDAETGEEIKRTEESNMVTDVPEKLFDIPRCGMFTMMNMPQIMNSFLPRAEKLFGGIMLLSTNVEENKATVTPPTGYAAIGTAGTVYSGTDTRRGTLNENESGPTDGGYRLVWDFGTDRANGTIKCIGLTSRIFGNIGFDPVKEGSESILCNPQYFDAGTFANSNYLISASGVSFIANLEPNVYLGIKVSYTEVTFVRYTLTDPDAVTVSCAPKDVAEEIAAVVTIPFIGDLNTRFYDPETNVLYLFRRDSIPGTDDDTFSYAGIDVGTFKLKTSGSFTTARYSWAYPAIYRGNVYRHLGDQIEVSSLSGAVEKTIPAAGGNNAYFYVYDGHLCYGFDKSNIHYHARVDCAEVNGSYGVEGFPVYSRYVKPPYTLYSTRRQAQNTLHILMHAGYMATINNLADPIEKTDRHALKIIYELTD